MFSFWKSFILLTLGILLGLIFSSTFAFAMAKPPATGGSCSTGPGTPNPLRKVVLRHVGTKPFHLPNGSVVDINADLDSMLSTSTTNTANLVPLSAPASSDPCDSHLELSAAVTTLELDAWEFGATFGFTPSGELGTISNLKANAKVKIGTIGMDFAVWQCTGSSCTSQVASNATQATASVSLDLEIDFSTITTGPGLVYNTPLGDAVRKIMDQGVGLLSSSPRLSLLPWYATVREYDTGPGAVLLDMGTQDRIGTSQTFTVFSPIAATSSCPVFKPAAYVHTTEVENVSSYAQVDTVLDASGIKTGDRVMVRVTQ
jgi:hypothetical protein